MSLFTPDFAAATAGFPVYEKGMYRVKVTRRIPFVYERTDDDGNVDVVQGVHFNLEMAGRYDDEGDLETDGLAGKPVSRNTIYIHTPKALDFGKLFLMAACGYALKQQNEANEELFQGGDWTLSGDPGDDAENIELGRSWDEPVDRFVDVFLTKEVETYNNVERENQSFNAWAPVKA